MKNGFYYFVGLIYRHSLYLLFGLLDLAFASTRSASKQVVAFSTGVHIPFGCLFPTTSSVIDVSAGFKEPLVGTINNGDPLQQVGCSFGV